MNTKVSSGVEVAQLTIRRNGEVLLRDVSFSLKPDESVAIVGPNGAGKTTVLRAIGGLLRPYQGSIRIAGREVRDLSSDTLSHLVGFVPHRLPHVPPFTVREFLDLSGVARLSETHELVQQLQDRLLTQLSAGELQRVLVAGAIAQGASLLLLDEPTANVDPLGRKQIEELLRTCRTSLKVSYILVTHDISLAARLADRVLVMLNGALEWSGTTADPAFVQALTRCYGCSFIELSHECLMAPIIAPV